MADKEQPPAEEQPPAPPAEGEAPPAPELPELDRATILALLDKHGEDPDFRKDLRQRRWLGGMAGEIAAQQRVQEQQEAAANAIAAEKQRLKDLYENDRVAFADEIKTKLDVEEERREKAGLRDMTRREFAAKVGDALRDLPEFGELTAQDVEALSKSLAGVPEDDVVAVFTKKATDIVANKRAQKISEANKSEWLAAERKVWDAEQAQKRAQERRSPSIRQPSQGNATDDGEPADYLSPAWDAWYTQQRKTGRLAGVR